MDFILPLATAASRKTLPLQGMVLIKYLCLPCYNYI